MLTKIIVSSYFESIALTEVAIKITKMKKRMFRGIELGDTAAICPDIIIPIRFDITLYIETHIEFIGVELIIAAGSIIDAILTIINLVDPESLSYGVF